MPLPDDSETTLVAKIPCSACGQEPKSGAVVWDKWLCYPCINEWNEYFPSDESFYASHPEDKARFAAKKALTAKWVEFKSNRGNAA